MEAQRVIIIDKLRHTDWFCKSFLEWQLGHSCITEFCSLGIKTIFCELIPILPMSAPGPRSIHPLQVIPMSSQIQIWLTEGYKQVPEKRKTSISSGQPLSIGKLLSSQYIFSLIFYIDNELS